MWKESPTFKQAVGIPDMTFPVHLEEEISCLISAEITPTIIQMPVSEMAHQISVVGVMLETPAVRLLRISKTLKTA